MCPAHPQTEAIRCSTHRSSKLPPHRLQRPTSAGAPPADIDQGKLVLVVDDDAGVRRFVKAALERAGLRVVEAEDGVEALRLLDTVKPDLLLTDIVMPKMDGIALAREVVNKFPQLPILLMSAFTSDLDQSVKTRGFIRKPVPPKMLVQTVIQELRSSC
jgi:two-component system, cell cycle sensor histidine kinase and response regulator CckA